MADRTVLVTAFEPWGDFGTNPTRDVIQGIKGRWIRGCPIVTGLLPVDFHRAPASLTFLIEKYRPFVILSIGLAARRSQMELERYAHNRAKTAVPGHGEQVQPLVRGAPSRLETPLPVVRLCQSLVQQGFPVAVSEDAGDFVCNAILFHLLIRRRGSPDAPSVAFLHIPWLKESPAEDRSRPHGSAGTPLPREMVIAMVLKLLTQL